MGRGRSWISITTRGFMQSFSSSASHIRSTFAFDTRYFRLKFCNWYSCLCTSSSPPFRWLGNTVWQQQWMKETLREMVTLVMVPSNIYLLPTGAQSGEKELTLDSEEVHLPLRTVKKIWVSCYLLFTELCMTNVWLGIPNWRFFSIRINLYETVTICENRKSY